MSSKEINSIDELPALAEEIISNISAPFEIGLIGQLGAGKTTFSKHLAKALGVNEEITSPSYIYCADYQFNGKILEHWDLYRCTTIPEELIEPPERNTIRIIEWVDKFSNIREQLDLFIEIKIPDFGNFPSKRVVKILPSYRQLSNS